MVDVPKLLYVPEASTRLLLAAHASRKVRAFSFGGGVQSHGVLMMQARGMLIDPYDVFVFANVGNDSENKGTLEYIETYTKPFCLAHNIKFVEVQHTYKGKPETLLQALERSKTSIIIPAYTKRNGGRQHRNCTVDFKVVVVAKYLREQGFTHVHLGLGISVDEIERLKDTNWYTEDGLEKRRHYPLIPARLSRQDCINLITENGLPEPPPSRCKFCPLKGRNDWFAVKADPDAWRTSLEVERIINSKSTALTAPHVYLHRDAMPLEQAVGNQPMLMPFIDDSPCDEGVCGV